MPSRSSANVGSRAGELRCVRTGGSVSNTDKNGRPE